MPAFTFNVASGLFSVPTNWSPNGVPGAADTVTISGGRVCTLDMGTHTLQSVTLNGGSLIFSRTVSNVLTLTVGPGLTGNSGSNVLDMGTEASPIPAGIDAAIILPGNVQVDLNNTTFSLVSGVARTRKTRTSAAITAGATSIQVLAADNWQAGDELYLVPNVRSAAPLADTQVVTIGPGYTGGLTIPLTGSVTVARDSGAHVVNITSNVRFRNNATTQRARFTNLRSVANGFVAVNAEIRMGGFDNQVLASLGGTTVPGGFVARVQSSVFAAFSVGSNSRIRVRQGAELSDVAIISNSVAAPENAAAVPQKEQGVMTNCLVVGSFPLGSIAQLPGGVTTDCTFISINAGTQPAPLLIGSQNERFAGCEFVSLAATSSLQLVSLNCGGAQFVSCNFDPVGSEPRPFWNFAAPSAATPNMAGLGSRVVFEDCVLPPQAPNYTRGQWPGVEVLLNRCRTSAFPSFVFDELWLNSVNCQSAATPRKNSATSFLWQIRAAGFEQTLSESYPIGAGQTVTVLVNIRRIAAYGSGNMPSVALSIPGQTTVVSAAPDVADVWHQQSLTITNPGAQPSTVTITLRTLGAAVNAEAYFDGLPWPVFVTAARWYGYEFDEANPFRVIDPTITLTEAAAAAVTGVSINHGTQTITVTAARTAAEIYCFCMLDLVNNLDGSGNYRTRHITSSGGVVTTTYTVTLSGAGAISGGQIVAANGATGLISISGLTGGSANAQIWVGNDAGVQQDFAPSVTGTYSYSIPFGATGIWRVVVNKPGYFPQVFQVTPGQTTSLNVALEPILNPDGTVLYTGASTPISASFVTAGNAVFHFGVEVTAQQLFDASQDAYSLAAGMAWLAAGNAELRVIKTNVGQFAFLPLRTRFSGTALPAAFSGFATSEDNVVIDPASPFPIRFAQPPSGAWTEELEAGFTSSRILRIIAAAVAGETAGGPAGFTARNLSDTADQIVGTATPDGNRTPTSYGA